LLFVIDWRAIVKNGIMPLFISLYTAVIPVIGGILFDATMATSTANKTNQPTVASSYYYGENKKLLTFISSQQAFLNKE
jgi:uncharacterized membrane protein